MKPNLLILSLAVLSLLSSCRKEVGPTTVQVEDSIRHYYPVSMGDKLNIGYTIYNTGKEPFVITDIQPSCGCIVEGEENERIILPGKSLMIHFQFDSNKNIGYVHHTIRVYGNVKPRGVVSLIFDVNVVPPSDNTPDYEELYKRRKEEERASGIEEKVNGSYSERGYYTDDASEDSRSQNRYFWRGKKND